MKGQVPPEVAPIQAAGKAWLFMDYDGTLAEFSDTPDELEPNPEIIQLLETLVAIPTLRVAVISGRRLSHSRKLLPIEGLTIAGTYGIELWIPGQEPGQEQPTGSIRQVLDPIKERWQDLIADHPGFFLEDKGYALALHARFADELSGRDILRRASRTVRDAGYLHEVKLWGGDRFLEVLPKSADKGNTVSFLWQHYPFPGATPVYLGDDDKDEAGFKVVRELGGMAILISTQERSSYASYRLQNPATARAWLRKLASDLTSG